MLARSINSLGQTLGELVVSAGLVLLAPVGQIYPAHLRASLAAAMGPSRVDYGLPWQDPFIFSSFHTLFHA